MERVSSLLLLSEQLFVYRLTSGLHYNTSCIRMNAQSRIWAFRLGYSFVEVDGGFIPVLPFEILIDPLGVSMPLNLAQ